MGRLLIRAFAAMLLAAPAAAPAETVVDLGLELAVVDGGPLPSFQDGSQGKLRYGTGDDSLELPTGYLQVRTDIGASWALNVTLDVNGQTDDRLGLTDAYLQFRPLPVAGIRWRAKIGTFRPPVSFEHGPNGWETLYTTNASAINSWVGEELGGLGVEVSAKRDLAAGASRWYWAGGGALFYGNDPAGTLLSWRGWSLNNWQTHWGGEVALADRPVFAFVPEQAPASEPFLELDGDPGYYAWLEAGNAGSFRVRALHYDNRADVAAAGHGQTGWHTTFSSLAVQLELPARIGLVAQSMDGRTYAGPRLYGVHAIDNDFQGHFVLLTRLTGRHRVSVRRDWFEIDDEDLGTIDPNGEDGRAWTLSYQYRPNETWTFGLEWLEIDSRHPARVFEQAPVNLTERGWFFVLRWRY